MEEKLKKVLSQILRVPQNEITSNSSPDNISSWDSLQHMNIMLALEQSFGVSFTDEEIVESLSYEIILETLNEKL